MQLARHPLALVGDAVLARPRDELLLQRLVLAQRRLELLHELRAPLVALLSPTYAKNMIALATPTFTTMIRA